MVSQGYEDFAVPAEGPQVLLIDDAGRDRPGLTGSLTSILATRFLQLSAEQGLDGIPCLLGVRDRGALG